MGKTYKTIICLVASVSISVLLLTEPLLAKAPAKTLKIGATAAFATKLGIQLKKVLELLAEQTNGAGGITVKGQEYTIEYVIYDDKYDANAGRAAAERLVFKDNAKFIAGIYGSAPTLAMLEVTESNKIPVLTGAATQKIYDTKYKYVVHSRQMRSSVPADYVYWKEKQLIPASAKTMVLAGEDDETGHAMCAYEKVCAESAGYKVKDIIYYKRGVTDFTPVATKLGSLSADIFHPSTLMAGGPLFNMVKAVSESSWKGTIISRYAQDTVPAMVKEFGKQALEGLIFNYADLSEIPNPPQGFFSFKEAYTKKYGTWETDALEWCSGYYLLLAAIKKADSLQADDVMAAMAGLSYTWLRGTGQMFRRPDMGNNRFCDCAVDIHVGQVRDGKPHFAGIMTKEFQLDVVEKSVGQKVR